MSGSYTERFTEDHYPLVTVPPAVKSPAAEQISAYVSLANYHRAVCVIQTGAIAATGTVQVRLLQATTTAGASAKGIPTTATQDKITTVLTTADANSVVAIELRTEELDVSNGFDCVAVAYDVDTDTVALGIILYGIISRFDPTPTTNYNEIVG
jgi:hypothetical protein